MIISFFKNRKVKHISNKYYLMLQDKWAKKMSSLTSGLSRKRMLVLYVFFVGFTGIINLSLICRGFESDLSYEMDVFPISRASGINNKSTNESSKPMPLKKGEYKKLMHFKIFTDSLLKSPAGKVIYDSIKSARPHLLDSIAVIENYYKINLNE